MNRKWPKNILWGKTTSQNIKKEPHIGNDVPNVFINNIALIKYCYILNLKSEVLNQTRVALISASKEIMIGKHKNQFHFLIEGSNTDENINTNINEVIQTIVKRKINKNVDLNFLNFNNKTQNIVAAGVYISIINEINNKLFPSLQEINQKLWKELKKSNDDKLHERILKLAFYKKNFITLILPRLLELPISNENKDNWNSWIKIINEDVKFNNRYWDVFLLEVFNALQLIFISIYRIILYLKTNDNLHPSQLLTKLMDVSNNGILLITDYQSVMKTGYKILRILDGIQYMESNWL